MFRQLFAAACSLWNFCFHFSEAEQDDRPRVIVPFFCLIHKKGEREYEQPTARP